MTDDLFAVKTHSAFIGIGSNLGDRRANIEQAIALIAAIPETALKDTSPLLEFPAQDTPGPQPDFLNAVVRIETELLPLDLLEKLQIIERKLGRTSKGDRSARPVDLDILAYGDRVLFLGKSLVIPHPRLHERPFVLEPLARIAPEWTHQRLGKTARELLEGMAR